MIKQIIIATVKEVMSFMIHIENLTKYYRKNPAVNNISFDIGDGEYSMSNFLIKIDGKKYSKAIHC